MFCRRYSVLLGSSSTAKLGTTFAAVEDRLAEAMGKPGAKVGFVSFCLPGYRMLDDAAVLGWVLLRFVELVKKGAG